MNTIISHQWHALTSDEVMSVVHGVPDGLDERQVHDRLERHGRNDILTHDEARVWRILLRQFVNPLILILIAAGVISLALSSFVDAGVIFGAVLINALVGFGQEYKVSAILSKLQKQLRTDAKVLRAGHLHVIDARDIVPGDIMVLRQGDRVWADARIVRESNLRTNESALTGESLPVEKLSHVVSADDPVSDRRNMVFMGTLVEEGTARAVVVGTGLNTEFGVIARLVMQERAKDVTPLQVRFDRLAKFLGVFFLIASSIFFIAGVALGRDPLIMLLTAVAVAVAAVPESLPVSVSIVLAIGAGRILAKGGLVRKMSAAETLGSVTVIATDKTATLTEGTMAVDRLVIADRSEIPVGALRLRMHNAPTLRVLVERIVSTGNAFFAQPSMQTEGRDIVGSPVDSAILRMSVSAGINHDALGLQYMRTDELPFDARRKRSAVLVRSQAKTVVCVLGAPEAILSASTIDDPLRTFMEHRTKQLAATGFRVLAFGTREVSSVPERFSNDDIRDLTFEGLIVLTDPLRSGIPGIVASAQQAGIRLVMVTGDHAQTAEYIARESGILMGPGRVITGKELPEDVSLILSQYDVFARVSPDDKVRIVQGFQSRGETIAMIGDGVNDAPSLLRADIGVAVGSGTDVARDAADLVLLKDSFRIIVEAIHQGRIIFDNIVKVAIFLLSDVLSEVVLLGGSIVFGLPLAMLPAQILWVNIIADVLPAIALAWDNNHEEATRQQPRNINGMFTGGIRKLIVLFTIVTVGALFALFAELLAFGGPIEHTRTMVFVGLGLTSLVYVYSVRSLTRPIWRINPFSNMFLNVAVFIGLAMYGVAVYIEPIQRMLQTVALSVSDWGILVGLAFFNLAVFEFGKQLFIHRTDGA